jgi:hypothetical protein
VTPYLPHPLRKEKWCWNEGSKLITVMVLENDGRGVAVMVVTLESYGDGVRLWCQSVTFTTLDTCDPILPRLRIKTERKVKVEVLDSINSTAGQTD